MIKAARLTTGEFIIGDVEIHGEAFTIKDPLLFEATPVKDQEGKMSLRIGFQALIPMGHPGSMVTMKESHILFWLNEPDERLVEGYNNILSPVQAVKAMPPNLTLSK